jgi:hypothetical protein
MIRHSLLSVVASFAIACTALGAPPSDRLLDAIAKVESNHNPNAVGDDGKAIGVFQIHRVYWQDAVQHDPSIGGCYEDCRDPEYARRIVIAYMDRYAPANASDETLARIHNGGPRGHKKAATTKYWNKVKKAMK